MMSSISSLSTNSSWKFLPQSLFVAAFLSLVVMGCDSDSDSPADGEGVQLSFTGLEALNGGFHYEGWAILSTGPVSTGKFNVSATGAIVDLSGNSFSNGTFDAGQDITGATAIVLTIEPSGDTDSVPAATHVLSGDVTSGAASLTAGHGAALGDDYSTAAGSFIIATPTTAVTTDENSGIWFLDNSSGSPVAGLTLPTLPAGWAYEGWVVFDGTPISTGTFTSVNGSDNSSVFSGTAAGPAYPGEDFVTAAPTGLTFPTDLSGRTAVISIEPSPDDSEAPYTFKPLAGPIPATVVNGTVYSIPTNLSSFPTGSATIK